MESNSITGDSIVTAFKRDIEALFSSDPVFELRIQIEGFLPSCKGVGKKARLCLPSDFLTQAIENPKDFVFLLLVLGHETAHYLNRHNEHDDKSKIESQGIEMWADFFGTKIAFVTMTFGRELSKLLTFMPKNVMNRIDVFALALEKLSDAYFQHSGPKYPETSTRIGTYVAGLMSFLEQYFKWSAADSGDLDAYAKAQDPEVIVQRALSIQMRIYTNQKLRSRAMFSEGQGLDKTNFEIISEVQRGIQGKQDALFKGMKPLPATWLRLDYSIPESNRKKIVVEKHALLTKTLTRLGIDPSS
jgi:hypothetical protein